MIQKKENCNYNSYNHCNLISFSAKMPKLIPTAEEIAQRKALEFQAINQRKTLPVILQLLYPLPVSSGIKAKHVQEINKNILSDDYLGKYPVFKNSIKKFLLDNNEKDLLLKEKNSLNSIMYSNTNVDNILIDDIPYIDLINKAFNNIHILKDISIKEKALVLSILQDFSIDGGELGKNCIKEYHNLIQYAKDNKEKLTEPVEDLLTDNEIDSYFEKNKIKSFIALSTIGGHPTRQRLEHRLNKFDKSLNTIEVLFNIPELRDDLVTICKNQNKVNPAEIIKFLELSKGFLDLGKSFLELRKIMNSSILNEGINIDYLSEEYLKTLFLSYNKQAKFPDFSKWDLNNVYTIPYFLSNNSLEHKEKFKELFLSTINNGYYDLIHSSNNSYGQGNIKTMNLFKDNDLNYNIWLNYNKEKTFSLLSKSEYIKQQKDILAISKFPKQSEECTIRVWKRNPQQDLFQGRTAAQCIALDGINGFAGVDELLYSYAQLIEIVNKSKNKTIGNACSYWIKDDFGNKALLIDSIGIHPEYENNPQIRNEIFAFAKEYASVVSGEPTKIYIGNQFNKLDVQDLSQPIKDKFKIIGNTNNQKSYLDAIIAKDRHERYTIIDDNKDYLMEIREIK